MPNDFFQNRGQGKGLDWRELIGIKFVYTHIAGSIAGKGRGGGVNLPTDTDTPF